MESLLVDEVSTHEATKCDLVFARSSGYLAEGHDLMNSTQVDNCSLYRTSLASTIISGAVKEQRRFIRVRVAVLVLDFPSFAEKHKLSCTLGAE